MQNSPHCFIISMKGIYMSAIRFFKVKTKDIFWLCFTLIGQHVNELWGKLYLYSITAKTWREVYILVVVCDDGLVQIYEENSNYRYSTTAKTGRELYMLKVVGMNIISMDEENDDFVLCSFFFTELFIGSGGEWH